MFEELRSCVNISILFDDLREEDETFVINASPFNNSLFSEDLFPFPFVQASITIIDGEFNVIMHA